MPQDKAQEYVAVSNYIGHFNSTEHIGTDNRYALFFSVRKIRLYGAFTHRKPTHRNAWAFATY